MQYRKLSELKKLPNNPRIIKDDSFKKLCTSISTLKEYFEARPIILSDRTGDLVIIAGNQRYEAAKATGLTEVPTHLLSGLTEAKEREIVIRDNVANGDWDWSELANAWDDVELHEWGVELPYISSNEIEDIKEIYQDELKFTYSIKCENIEELNTLKSRFKTEKTTVKYSEIEIRL